MRKITRRWPKISRALSSSPKSRDHPATYQLFLTKLVIISPSGVAPVIWNYKLVSCQMKNHLQANEFNLQFCGEFHKFKSNYTRANEFYWYREGAGWITLLGKYHGDYFPPTQQWLFGSHFQKLKAEALFMISSIQSWVLAFSPGLRTLVCNNKFSWHTSNVINIISMLTS